MIWWAPCITLNFGFLALSGRAANGAGCCPSWAKGRSRAGRTGAVGGWRHLFADKYPTAGGAGHYAAYLVNSDGFEVELIATG